MSWILWISLLNTVIGLQVYGVLSSLADLNLGVEENRAGFDAHSVWTDKQLWQPDPYTSHHHHISKRSAATSYAFTLAKYGFVADHSLTHIRPGDQFTHRLTSVISDAGSVYVTVEIQVPVVHDDDLNMTSSVFSLCPPSLVSVGGNFEGLTATNMAEVVGVMTTGLDGKNEKAIVYYGEFTRSTASPDNSADSIVLEFDFIVNDHSAIQAGSTHDLEVTVTYGADDQVWTGGETYTSATGNTLTSSTSPSFSVSNGPGDFTKGTNAYWVLSMTLYNAVNDLEIVVTEQNSLLFGNAPELVKICRIMVGDAGDSYGCYPDSAANFEYMNGRQDQAKFMLRDLNNGLFWQTASAEQNTVDIEIDVLLRNVSDVLEDTSYTLLFSVSDLGAEQIWSDDMQFTARAADFTANADLPQFSIAAAHSTVMWGLPTTFYLNMTIPPSQADTYYLEIALPADTAAVMTFCTSEPIALYYVGHNYPCLDSTVLDSYVIEATTSDTGAMDYLRLDLGILSNVGYLDASDTDANTLVFAFRARVLQSHVNVTDGDVLSIAAGVKLGEDTIWVGEVEVTVDSTPEIVAEEPTLTEFSAMNERDWGKLYKGGSTVHVLGLRLPAGSMYEYVNISLTAAMFDGSPVLDLCDVTWRNETMGADIHRQCLLQDDIPGLIIKDRALVKQTDNYAAHQLNFTVVGTLINGAYGNYWWNFNDSMIYFFVHILDSTHPGLSGGDSVTFDVSVDYGGSSTIDKTVSFTYTDAIPVLGSDDSNPTVEMYSNAEILGPSNLLEISIDIITPPRTMLPYRIEALADDDVITFCRMEVFEAEKNVTSCQHDNYPYGSSYHAYTGAHDNVTCTDEEAAGGSCLSTLFNFASLDMGGVSNFDQNALNEFGDGALVSVLLVAKIHPDASFTEEQASTVTLGVFMGDTSLWVNQVDLTLTEMDTGQESFAPEGFHVFEYEKYNDAASIAIGGGAVYVLTGNTLPGAPSDFLAEFASPVDGIRDARMAYIGEVRFMSAGFNLPCVNDKWMSKTYASVENFTTAVSLDMGSMANQNYHDHGFHGVNDFRVEVVVCVPENTQASDGQELDTSASVEVDGSELYTTSLLYTVTSAIPASETSGDVWFEFAELYEIPTVTYGEQTSRTVYIRTGMITSTLTLTFQLPEGGGQNHLTISRLHVSTVGKNFPCHADMEANVLLPVDSTQTAELGVQLGTVTNTGTSTRYQYEMYDPLDDVIQITYDVIAAQHSDLNVFDNANPAAYIVQLVANGGSPIDILDYVNVERPSPPTAELNLYLERLNEDPDSLPQPGDTIQFSVRLNHTWASTGHAYDVTVNVYAGVHLALDTVEGWERITYTTDNSQGYPKYTIPELFFSDNETLTLNFTLDPNDQLPRGEDYQVQLVLDVVFEDRDIDEVTALNDYLISQKLHVPVFRPECDAALGVEDGGMQDCQINASSALSGFEAEHVRLNSASYWSPATRGGPFTDREYIQFDLHHKTRLTGVTLQGPTGSADIIQQFNLSTSENGKIWSSAGFDVSGLVSGYVADSTVFVDLGGEDALTTRYLRLQPIADAGIDPNVFGLRLELHGCTVEENPNPVCGEAESDRELYQRGWLMDDTYGRLYVCFLRDIDAYVSCSYTEDFGERWEKIDDNVANINFLLVVGETSSLYGLARNRQSLMRSDDWGRNWCTVSEQEYLDAEQEQVVSVQRLPFEDWDGVSYEQISNDYGFDFNVTLRWTVSSDGIAIFDGSTSTLVSKWYL